MRSIAMIAAALTVSSILACTVLAKDPNEERISALEAKVTALSNPAHNQEMASALSRLSTFQDEFGGLKGQLEASDYMIKTQSAELGRRIDSLDHRIQAIEDRLSIFATQLTQALGKVAPATAAEGDMYQKGLDLASASKYLEAASAFESFLGKYPQSNFAPNAKFWIGECFYSMRDWQRAIKEYQSFIDKFPKSQQVAEATFKQGTSFYELGMYDEAKAFYERVRNSYPGSAAAAQVPDRLAKIEKKKAGGAAAPTGSDLGTYPAETLEQKMQRRMDPLSATPQAPSDLPVQTTKPNTTAPGGKAAPAVKPAPPQKGTTPRDF